MVPLRPPRVLVDIVFLAIYLNPAPGLSQLSHTACVHEDSAFVTAHLGDFLVGGHPAHELQVIADSVLVLI